MSTEGEWEKQEGVSNIWLPKKVGDELVGAVIEIKEGLYGKNYVIKTDNNEEYLTPSNKMLQSRMIEVDVGDVVKITFDGEDLPKVKGWNKTKLYSVYKRKTDSEHVAVTKDTVQ